MSGEGGPAGEIGAQEDWTGIHGECPTGAPARSGASPGATAPGQVNAKPPRPGGAPQARSAGPRTGCAGRPPANHPAGPPPGSNNSLSHPTPPASIAGGGSERINAIATAAGSARQILPLVAPENFPSAKSPTAPWAQWPSSASPSAVAARPAVAAPQPSWATWASAAVQDSRSSPARMRSSAGRTAACYRGAPPTETARCVITWRGWPRWRGGSVRGRGRAASKIFRGGRCSATRPRPPGGSHRRHRLSNGPRHPACYFFVAFSSTSGAGSAAPPSADFSQPRRQK